MSITINSTPIDIEITRTNNNVDVTTTQIDVAVSTVGAVVQTLGVLQGFDTMTEAINTLGNDKLFYYNRNNLDGATFGSVHITKTI